VTAKIDLKEMSSKRERFAPGHRACAGCPETIVVRQVLQAIDDPVVVASPTGCLEIISSPFPYTSWRVPWIHSAFENVASTIAGVETMYRSLVKQGKMQNRGIKFVAFAGDGATYDIGLQFLSGALERGHKFLYVCLNNEAYMNTGIQRSSATPLGTWTTTSPVGAVVPGKKENRKDLTAIVVAHNIPYVAQAAPHAWRDLMTKARTAIAADGPSFINVLVPCPRGWRFSSEQAIAISRLAVETCVWPLYEVIDGEWKLNHRPSSKKPITDWLESQGRFQHLLRPGNEHLVDALQQNVDREWAKLLERCKLAA
jgi:pyruvate ferredoxin oxidoreductase beta subunit